MATGTHCGFAFVAVHPHELVETGDRRHLRDRTQTVLIALQRCGRFLAFGKLAHELRQLAPCERRRPRNPAQAGGRRADARPGRESRTGRRRSCWRTGDCPRGRSPRCRSAPDRASPRWRALPAARPWFQRSCGDRRIAKWLMTPRRKGAWRPLAAVPRPERRRYPHLSPVHRDC